MRRVSVVCALLALILSPATAQTGNSAWRAWARANHHPIATTQSFDGDTFEDLQFLKSVLRDRRLVQLGESGHGVADFNHVKVRLIKFLHQQMGFDVIAFESGMYECFNADRFADDMAARDVMRHCIFGVWHTNEVLPLFEYLKSTRSTSRPLTLAGFDTQVSSSFGVATRPAFLGALVGAVDSERGTRVQDEDRQHVDAIFSGTARQYAKANEARLSAFYGGLEQFFRDNRTGLAATFGDWLPRIAERAAWSMLRYEEQLRAHLDRPTDTGDQGGGAIRDLGMANNLTFLANELYPGRKILVWAHNFHIRHDNSATTSGQKTMGRWIRERFRPELYTIGLYMNSGLAAYNDRQLYRIFAGAPDLMEWVMNGAGSRTLFMDFLHQGQVEGNGWMFQPTFQRDWGTVLFQMVPRDQYDGVVFVDDVHAPSYLTFQ
jgi:erythromycin esterase